MNMISQIRKKLLQDGSVTISIDDFNELQAEWITRAMPEGVMGIPLDSRYEQQEPKVTNAMKSYCHGAYSWEEDAPYYDENGDIQEHTATREVPWDLCKTIYKQMATMANASLSIES